MGVWIEITPDLFPWSREPGSHPLWVCGLKFLRLFCFVLRFFVTPFMGVWIEIGKLKLCDFIKNVTPFMGVWIEIILQMWKQHIIYRHTLYGCVD